MQVGGMKDGEDRVVVRMKCRCGYTYTILVFSVPVYEICPVCGHSAPIAEFLVEDSNVS